MQLKLYIGIKKYIEYIFNFFKYKFLNFGFIHNKLNL